MCGPGPPEGHASRSRVDSTPCEANGEIQQESGAYAKSLYENKEMTPTTHNRLETSSGPDVIISLNRTAMVNGGRWPKCSDWLSPAS